MVVVYYSLSQSICVCWNKAIRSLQEQYGVLVEDNASVILQCFSNTLHHKLLDTATQVGTSVLLCLLFEFTAVGGDVRR